MREVLKVCWQLTQEIRNERGRQKELREMVAALVGEMAGQVRNENQESKVERLTIAIIDSERRIEALREVKMECIIELRGLLERLIEDRATRTVLLLRYGYCRLFRDIGLKMGYSERRVYQLHGAGLKKIAVQFQ